MEYCVYVLLSQKCGTTYVGFTTDLISRFRSHNGRASKGWTVRDRPWQVAYCEFFDNKQDAMSREKQLKSGKGREWLRKEVITDKLNVGFISA